MITADGPFGDPLPPYPLTPLELETALELARRDGHRAGWYRGFAYGVVGTLAATWLAHSLWTALQL